MVGVSVRTKYFISDISRNNNIKYTFLTQLFIFFQWMLWTSRMYKIQKNQQILTNY